MQAMPRKVAYTGFALMLLASILAMVLRPSHKLASENERIVLEQVIPSQFLDWKKVETAAPLVNPQTEEAVNKIYAQTLSRTYSNSKGETMMLSIAYGEDQSDGVGAHLPEGCYGGQGFLVAGVNRTNINTPYADIPATRLVASKGNRTEPITYWLRTGEKLTNPGWPTKKVKLWYGLRGNIPDGLLLRVSSITDDVEAGYLTQQKFIEALLTALTPEQRLYLVGYERSKKNS
jgi:EpsI family protein